MARPPAPSDFTKINFAVNQWADWCDAPASVYLEMLKPATMQLAINLICWDWDDIARWFFKPAGLRAGSHFRTKEKKSRKRRSPTWDQRLKQIIPGMSDFGARRVPAGVATLWIIDGVIQRSINYYVMYHAIKEFVYDYTTMIYRTDYCQNSTLPAKSKATGDTTNLPAIAGWVDLAVNQNQSSHGDVQPTQFGVLLGAGSFTVSAAVTWKSSTHGEGQVQHRLKIEQGAETFYVYSPPATLPLGGEVSTLIITKARDGAAITLQGDLQTGFANTENFLETYRSPEGLPYPTRDRCKTIPLDPYKPWDQEAV